MSTPEKVVNVMICPTVTSPRARRTTPSEKMPRTVSVEDVRVATETTAHQDSTGICARRKRAIVSRRAPTSASTRGKALHDGDVRDGVRGALGELGVHFLDRALQLVRPADDDRGDGAEDRHEGHEHHAHPELDEERERQQHEHGDERREMGAEEREPEAPHPVGSVQHHLEDAPGVRPDVERLRQAQRMLEVLGDDREPAAVGQAIGVERRVHARGDGEDAEGSPCLARSREGGPCWPGSRPVA